MARIKFDKTVFDTITKLTGDLKRIIDSETKYYVEYCADVRSKYLPEVAEKEILAKRAETKKKIDSARVSTESLIDGQFQKVRDTVNTWTGAAPDDRFMNLISTIRNCGITPDRTEFNNLLNQCSGSYWEVKALTKLAEDSGISFKYPSEEVFNRRIADMQGGVNNFVRNYYGADPEAWVIAGDRNGTSYGDIPAYSMSMADAYIRKGSFAEDSDFLLNRIDDLYGISPAPFFKSDSDKG